MWNRLVTAILALLAVVPAQAATPGAVFASGSVIVFHDVCESIGTGEVRLALLPAEEASPTSAWTVLASAQSTEGCSAYGHAVCDGKGTLAEGVTFDICTGSVEGGSFGPVVVCYPGPSRPAAHTVAHDVAVVIDGNYGSFEGTLEADLFGTAVDEPQNLCD